VASGRREPSTTAEETPAARARRLGAGRAVEAGAELLEHAAEHGPESSEGIAARGAAARLYAQEARRLTRRAATAAPGEAAELRQTALELFARGLAVRPSAPPP